MLEAVSASATRTGEKLRRHGLETSHLTVFMHTSEFNPNDPRHAASTTVHLPEASNDTLDLVKAAQRGARAIYREGYRYAKAGIVMDDLIAAGTAPRPLFDRRDREQSERLMSAMDAVNAKFGRGMITPAAAGIRKEWQTKFEMRSPRYTTRVAELPRVRTG
jgi:DNA polymerase V